MSERIFTETADGGLQFVGDFEGLYKDERDPWDQSGRGGTKTRYYAQSRRRLIEALIDNKARGCGVEIGCGHGHLTARLQGSLRTHVVGMDISETAIAEARSQYPSCEFIEADILSFPLKGGTLGFALWGQCLWYLLHDIDAAIGNTLGGIRDGGLFVVNQAFLHDQRYGREFADGFVGALHLLTMRRDLTLIDAYYDDKGIDGLHDGTMIFRKVGP